MAQYRDEILLSKIVLRLKKLREKKGVSQEQVYNETDVHIARIETGKNNLSVSMLSKLCKYFDISLAEFFKGI
jgi:transcriptional regulator with XRE-family HTH domain